MMSRITPPPASGTPGVPDPHRRPIPQAHAPATGPGAPAQKPNVTTPKAPPVGQSAPPTRTGMPANKVSPPVGAKPQAPATPATPAKPGTGLPVAATGGAAPTGAAP